MNIQAIMKQAQQMQNKMLEEKKLIDGKTFEGISSLVKIFMTGDYVVTDVKFNLNEEFDLDDVDMLQDMVMIAINDAMTKIKKETEDKMGKYTKGIPGLF